ncbi:hypothetical protein Back2_00390 [Nocardioides baekrokdamisoli]|uniref:Uncharacterized protein n=1 Tax=Nocardioides baekrokdamisoli TaxID=1804624 RepID=A0A3G9IBQ5_9ACTN|nr:hypothetical protein [Nocardioides baekrokdamisoli]BBH15752.1 hypothetical protein Back2_00390 [Nocardioides baekrokdamisoli]
MSYEEYVSETRAKSVVTSDPLSEGTVASLARELRTTYALRADLESELAQAAAARRESAAQADVTISQAQTVANSLVSIATDEAAQIRRDAQTQAQAIREAAERDAEVILESAFEAASAANAARISGLERVATELRRSMESTFNSLDRIEGELAAESDAVVAPEPEADRAQLAVADVATAEVVKSKVAETEVADTEQVSTAVVAIEAPNTHATLAEEDHNLDVPERLVDRRHKRLGPVERDSDVLTRQRGWRK